MVCMRIGASMAEFVSLLTSLVAHTGAGRSALEPQPLFQILAWEILAGRADSW